MTAQNTMPITSYTETLLRYYYPMTLIVLTRTEWIKDRLADKNKQTLDSSKVSRVRLQQINLGPFQPFIRRVFHAYGTVSHFKQQSSEHNESVFKNEKKTSRTLHPLTKDEVDKVSLSQAERITESLNEKVYQHNKEWDNHFSEWADLLLHTLSDIGIQASELEQNEFHTQMPIDELLDVLQAAKIEHPGLKKAAHYDFKHYFSLKCRYLIYNNLSKNHQVIETKTISEHLKKIKPALQTVHQNEVEILKNIQHDYNEILKSIAFAKIQRKPKKSSKK
jgi:hypothetical protein